MIAPKPKDVFWQAAAGDGGDPRRPNPRAAIPGSGHAPGHRPTRVRDAGGGPCGRWITRVEEPRLAHAGSLVMWRPGEGAVTHISASLCLLLSTTEDEARITHLHTRN